MILTGVVKLVKKTCSCYSNHTVKRKSFTTNHGPPWSVMFFGTDDFSIYSLKSLYNDLKKGIYISNLEVVTSRKAKNNPVLKYCNNANLLVHDWPLKNISQKFDLGIVVSFGHLIPKEVINHFKYGILNVHASLLPRWRGAAPIIHAIANEDSQTGVTIMRIEPAKFDVGDILKQRSVDVPKDVTMPVLYQVLANLGAETLIECLHDLNNCLKQAQPQPKEGITYAPKVTSQMGLINFKKLPAQKIIALSRALYNLYPLTTTWNNVPIKLIDVSFSPVIMDYNVNKTIVSPGFVSYDKNLDRLLIYCSDGKSISVKKIGLPGKKPMTAKDFNNGYLKKEIVELRFFK